MELYSEEINNLKNAFKKLYLKSIELIPSQQQRDEMLDKLVNELFMEKLKKLEHEKDVISYDESQDLLIQLKKMAAEWINEFSEQERLKNVEQEVRKNV